jgi:molybdate transport system substrate-binding protein
MRWYALMAVAMLAGSSLPASATELKVLAAGSLTEVMGALSAAFATAGGPPVKASFGPSGVLRERIEKGEPVDLFASADMGHPLKLRADGRATNVVMFTRNTLCATALPKLGLTTETVLDKLLDPAVKVGTSTPKADPAGDYTWVMFHRADALRPGSFALLDAKAQQIVGGAGNNAPIDSKDPSNVALAAGTIDIMIGYCTSAQLRAKELPSLQIVAIPPEIRTGPEYGLAILKDAPPQATGFALFILSPEGQAILAKYGFLPVGLPST